MGPGTGLREWTGKTMSAFDSVMMTTLLKTCVESLLLPRVYRKHQKTGFRFDTILKP